MFRLAITLTVITLLPMARAGGQSTQPETDADQSEAQPIAVLVLTGGGYHDFSRNTAALLHGLERNDGRSFIVDLVSLNNAEVDADRYRRRIDLSEPDVFDRYDVILAYCQGEFDAFRDDVKERFLQFITAGGGYVAIHSAGDSHPGWKEYDAMLGGRFESHPPFSTITVQVDVVDHPVTRGLPEMWTLDDEFYHMKGVDEGNMLVLMRGRSPGDDDDAPLRPVSWVKPYGDGRVFYTILGHGIEAHTDSRMHQLIHNAIVWVADGDADDRKKQTKPHEQRPDP